MHSSRIAVHEAILRHPVEHHTGWAVLHLLQLWAAFRWFAASFSVCFVRQVQKGNKVQQLVGLGLLFKHHAPCHIVTVMTTTVPTALRCGMVTQLAAFASIICVCQTFDINAVSIQFCGSECTVTDTLWQKPWTDGAGGETNPSKPREGLVPHPSCCLIAS